MEGALKNTVTCTGLPFIIIQFSFSKADHLPWNLLISSILKQLYWSLSLLLTWQPNGTFGVPMDKSRNRLGKKVIIFCDRIVKEHVVLCLSHRVELTSNIYWNALGEEISLEKINAFFLYWFIYLTSNFLILDFKECKCLSV